MSSSRQHTLDSLIGSLSTKLKKRRSKPPEPEAERTSDILDTTTPPLVPRSEPESPHAAIMDCEGDGSGSVVPGLEISSGRFEEMPKGVDEADHGLGIVENWMNGNGNGNGNGNINEDRDGGQKEDGIGAGVLLKRQRSRTSPVHMNVNGSGHGYTDDRRQVNDNRHHSMPSSSDQNPDVLLEHSHELDMYGVDRDNNRDSVMDIFEGPGIAAALTSGGEGPPRRNGAGSEKILKLSPEKIQELTSSPQSVPFRTLRSSESDDAQHGPADATRSGQLLDGEIMEARADNNDTPATTVRERKDSLPNGRGRPHAPRTISTPTSSRRQMQPSSNSERLSQAWASRSKRDRSSAGGRIDLDLRNSNHHLAPPPSSQQPGDQLPSPIPPSIPLPPVSVPTYLQLELASGRPSPLYIHRSVPTEFPYESSRVKLERLTNFLVLPPVLEQVLWFGALACLDSWLYCFTILPLRFVKAVYILLESWAVNIGFEARYISGFIIKGVGRVWQRRRTRSVAGAESVCQPRTGSVKPEMPTIVERDAKNRLIEPGRRHRYSETRRPHHRRQKSIPSALFPDDKADILKGLLMIATCSVLMRFDASRMYHWIRGQAAIKLYVIYNVLEVSDRLFAALGQDVLECLFSREALERKPDGRSKVLRPFWLFLLALAYTVLHATALFYQVMTLNVAVNSYSNALITLLLSNQFVEIKSTVFKKFEKENLFQLTCADVVERFQLWLMLTIIALRNIVETGVFDIFGSLGSSFCSGNSSTSTNSTPLSTPPRTATSILPKSFTLFPSSLFSSFSGGANSFLPTLGQVMGPFLVVLGSEMLVDWLKHAYINKFNNTRPAIYSRFLDLLAKDYYTNAFADQNLTRRLGLPVIPLSCLFFRVSVQTYYMFLASLLPHPPSSSTTVVEAPHSLTSIHDSHGYNSSPGAFTLPPLSLKTIIPISAAKISALCRSFLANAVPAPARTVQIFTVIFIITGFIALLIFKLLLGMLLLSFARSRYKAMKSREVDHHHHHHHHHQHQHQHHLNNNHKHQYHPPPQGYTSKSDDSFPGTPRHRSYAVDGSRRVGGWGVVEVNDDKRRWIYADDPEALRKLKEKEDKEKERNVKETSAGGAGMIASMEHVSRYEMVAKRIW